MSSDLIAKLEPDAAAARSANGRGAVPRQRIRIQPTPGWRAIDLGEIWRFRELFYFLVWRDLKVRYKQTVLGAAWAVIQPLFSMLVFTLFFGKLANMPSDDIPYPIFSYAALLPWTYFANALSMASNSMVGSANLITKVYFPRLIIPGAAVVAGLVDFAIAFAVMVVMMLGYIFAGQCPVPSPAALIAVPLLTLLTSAFALGVSLWLSALNVRYRDIRYVVPFALQLWMFATPIIYPLSVVADKAPQFLWIMALNPMTGVVQGFRSALLGTPWDFVSLAFSLLLAAAVLVSGAFYFRRMERTFADIV
jgi:homopolymeric O-antigen transport system permease protein